MSNLEKAELDVRSLSPSELAAFRHWFAEFDAAAWDRQFEEDALSGKLDRLGQEALAQHRAGRSRKP